MGFLPQLVSLGAYVGTVLLALAIHGFVTLPLALRFLGQRSVPTYAKALSTPLMTAFSTSSSSATLPLTIEGLIEEAKVGVLAASLISAVGGYLFLLLVSRGSKPGGEKGSRT